MKNAMQSAMGQWVRSGISLEPRLEEYTEVSK